MKNMLTILAYATPLAIALLSGGLFDWAYLIIVLLALVPVFRWLLAGWAASWVVNRIFYKGKHPGKFVPLQVGAAKDGEPIYEDESGIRRNARGYRVVEY